MAWPIVAAEAGQEEADSVAVVVALADSVAAAAVAVVQAEDGNLTGDRQEAIGNKQSNFDGGVSLVGHLQC